MTMVIKVQNLKPKEEKEEKNDILDDLLLFNPDLDKYVDELDEEDVIVSRDDDDEDDMSEAGSILKSFDSTSRKPVDYSKIYTKEEIKDMGDTDPSLVLYDPDNIVSTVTGIDIDDVVSTSVGARIVKNQIGGHHKRRSSEDDYDKMFADEITLYYDTIRELDDIGKVAGDLVGLDKPKRAHQNRGVSKFLNDGYKNVISIKGHKLDAISKVVALKKTIADLRHRVSKDDNKNSDTEDMAAIGSSFLQQILDTGRSDLVNAVRGDNTGGLMVSALNQANVPVSDNDSLMGLIDEGDNNGAIDYSHDEMDDVSDRIRDRLQQVGNPDRTDDANKYIQYEADGVQVKVRRFVDTDEYEFFAEDKHGREVFDYPLPDPNDGMIGELTFAGRIAIDRRSEQYPVVEVYSDPNKDPNNLTNGFYENT